MCSARAALQAEFLKELQTRIVTVCNVELVPAGEAQASPEA